MDSRKRKPKEDAIRSHDVSNEKDELTQFGYAISIRIAQAKRLGLPKVRLEMVNVAMAERLLDLIVKEVGDAR